MPQYRAADPAVVDDIAAGFLFYRDVFGLSNAREDERQAATLTRAVTDGGFLAHVRFHNALNKR